MTGAYFLGQIPGGALLGRSDPEYDEDGLGLGFARDNEAAQHGRLLYHWFGLLDHQTKQFLPNFVRIITETRLL